MNVQIPSKNDILKTLAPTHPRLLADDAEIDRLRNAIDENSLMRQYHDFLRTQAEEILQKPLVRYDVADGVRLLFVSREVVSRVYTLGIVHRLNPEQKWIDRVWADIQAAANFPDWNPSHFLDTAEMAHAFGIAYDWFYHDWNDARLKSIRDAIIAKGIEPAMKAYRGEAEVCWWVNCEHNWNQVCNGGISTAALAIADDEPAIAAEVLAEALPRLPAAMQHFAPDGGWDEGPVYWRYANQYNVLILAVLSSALGTDFGLSEMPGFSEAGTFPIYATGPLGRTFNYGDASDNSVRSPEMFWFAKRFNRPEYAKYQRRLAKPAPLDLLWFDDREPETDDVPLDKHFRNIDIMTFRSSWDNENALFAGLKAGDNKANHGNLDLGTFVLDALCERWAIDLGPDDYNMPGYFASDRWTYYRMRPEGHNVCVVAPDAAPGQNPLAAGSVERFESAADGGFAIVDLTPAYLAVADKVRRGLALVDGRSRVVVQDEIDAQNASDIFWFMHTQAQIEVNGNQAMLTQNGKRLWARILSPADAEFSVMDAAPLPTSPDPACQARNAGVRKLVIHLKNMQQLRLSVVFVPLQADQQPPTVLPEVAELNDWR